MWCQGWLRVRAGSGEPSAGGSRLCPCTLYPSTRQEIGQEASTTGLEIHLPEDVPVVGVSTVPVPGWTVEITHRELDQPVEDHHGALITEVVSVIAWTVEDDAAAIGPGEAGAFPVVFGRLPDADTLVFRALQTYSNGDVVRWIELPDPAVELHNPAPVLELRPAGAEAGAASDAGTGPTGSGNQAAAGSEPANSAALWIALAGFAAGLGGLTLGGVAFARTRGASQPLETPAAD